MSGWIVVPMYRILQLSSQAIQNVQLIFIPVLEFESSMIFNFVLVWLYKYFDMSVTADESYVDETRVWRTKL